MHACNCSTQKAYAGGLLRVRGQLGLHSKTIPQNKMKPPPTTTIKRNKKHSTAEFANILQEQNSIAFLLVCVSKIVLFCFEGEAEFCCVTLTAYLSLQNADMSHRICCFFFLNILFTYFYFCICLCASVYVCLSCASGTQMAQKSASGLRDWSDKQLCVTMWVLRTKRESRSSKHS